MKNYIGIKKCREKLKQYRIVQLKICVKKMNLIEKLAAFKSFLNLGGRRPNFMLQFKKYINGEMRFKFLFLFQMRRVLPGT